MSIEGRKHMCVYIYIYTHTPGRATLHVRHAAETYTPGCSESLGYLPSNRDS